MLDPLDRQGLELAGETSLIAAIVIKALLAKSPEPELLLEAYQFIPVYCDVMGPMIGFSADEMEQLVSHLSGYIAQVDKTTMVLQQSKVSKKGKKRNRADLNVDSSDEPAVDPELQVAALRALISVLVTDPRSVTESCFKLIVATVVSEVLSLTTLRYAISERCVYAQPENRKVLYELMELVAKYPPFPEHRPLHVALHVFAEAARWDTRDIDSHIPAACRNALLTLQLIVEPVIAPHVLHPVLSSKERAPANEPGITSTECDEGPVVQTMHVSSDGLPHGALQSDTSSMSIVPMITTDDDIDDASYDREVDKSTQSPPLPSASPLNHPANTPHTKKMADVEAGIEDRTSNVPHVSDGQTAVSQTSVARASTIVSPELKEADMITISDDSSDEQIGTEPQLPDPSVLTSTPVLIDTLQAPAEVSVHSYAKPDEQPPPTADAGTGPSRTHVTGSAEPEVMDESIEEILATGNFGD